MWDHARDWRVMAAGVALVAAGGWLVLWHTTEPRTGWDGLMYHRFALEYAGAPVQEQEAVAWEIFERYGDPLLVEQTASGMRQGGSPWEALEDPSRERWVDIYRSRPAYSLLVAAGYPLLQVRAPLAVSALAVLVFTAALVVGAGLVTGYGVALIAALLSFANPRVAEWLIFLTPDGLGIALWAASLAATAVYVTTGAWRWLLLLTVTAVLLAFSRPLGAFLPVVLVLSALAAMAVRRPEWRRLGLAAGASVVAAAAFAIYSAALGLPGLAELLQDLPSRHFTRPEVADPLAWTIEVAALQVDDALLPTLMRDPSLWGSLLIGVVGLVAIGRSWALSPFVAAIAVLPLAYLAHPQLSEAPRIMAPIWASLNLGIALVLVAIVVRLQAPPPARAAARNPGP